MNRCERAFRLLAILAFGAAAEPVLVRDGREWRQPASTSGFNWNEFAAACPGDGTACTGQVVNAETSATVRVGGTWARNAEVRELLDGIIQPGTTNFANDFSNYGGLADDPDIGLLARPDRRCEQLPVR